MRSKGPKRSRGRLRAPFVVTAVAFVASAAACHSADDAAPDATEQDSLDETPPFDATTETDGDALDDGDAGAADCPEARPIVGSHCSQPQAWHCPYADPCPEAPSPGGTDDFTCVSHQWTTDLDAYALDCPKPAPEAGTPCLCAAHLPYACILALCPDLDPSAWALCDDTLRQWRLEETPCNPPPADPDAADADADGD